MAVLSTDPQPATDGVLGEGSNGVRGVSGTDQPSGSDPVPPPSGAGVWGTNTASGPGVYGTSKSGNGVRGDGLNGVFGQSSDPKGSGVLGQNTSTGAAIEGICKDTKGLAGKFTGNVDIDGDITAVNTVTVKKDISISGDITEVNNVAVNKNISIAGDITKVNTITVTKDVVLSGADCAEQFDLADLQAPEPGTILVIDDEGKLCESRRPYDRRVAGVVSGAGAYRPAILLDRRASEEGRVSVALVGKVYCKVDADPAPIAVGDMLTTSARPGFGMKAADPSQAFGAVVGKALKPLSTGQGLIPILVALQ